MKIICVGRNYADHIKELDNETPEEPVLFLKPETALVPKRNPFFLPDFSNNVHYEAELVIRICKIGKHIQPRFASRYYDQFTAGIDFTARDIQQKQKEKGLPWEIAKAFDGSAAIGKWQDLKNYSQKDGINFRLNKNGNVAQQGNSLNMLSDFDHLVSHISKYFTLKIGDLIFTGTPSGVGPVKKDDILELFIEDRPVLRLNVK